MTEIIENLHFTGLIAGLVTFLIIGLFHPLVIKGEYYFGVKIKWAFLAAGIVFTILCVMVENALASSLLGITAFSCFWSIKEVEEQVRRVEKGWFPRNPRRTSSPRSAD